MKQGRWLRSKLGVQQVLLLCLAIAGVMCYATTPVSADTSPVVSWGSYGTGVGQFDPAWGIAVDPEGNVYVGEDGTSGTIQKFDANGNFESVFVSGGVSHAAGMAFNGAGDLYVADSGYQQVREFNSSGSLLATIGSAGSGMGQFNEPMGIAFDSSGDFYVADYGNNRIEKFSSDGTYLAQWSVPSPSGVAVDNNGNVYATSASSDLIYKTTSTGNLLSTWGGSGTGAGELASPQGIAINSSDDIYVVDQGNSRIQEFTTDGSYIGQWGSAGTAVGQFSTPQFVAVSSTGYIYTTEYGNSRVQRFSPDIVTAPALPNAPGMLGPNNLTNGTPTSLQAPTFNFTLSSATSESLRYEVQVATTSDFTNPLIDYTSALTAQGAANFTVGQTPTGDGSYLAGAPGQTLPAGSYFWRVRAVDASGDQSPFTAATNTGSAFTIETAAPVVTALSPSDEAATASTTSSLTVSFSEPVIAVPNGTVQIYDVSNGSAVENLPATAIQITTIGSSTMATIPSPEFQNGTSYSVQISPGSFEDLAGNVTSPIAWSFSTIAAPLSAATTGTSSGSASKTTSTETAPLPTVTLVSQQEASPPAPAVKGAATTQPSVANTPQSVTADLNSSSLPKSPSKPTTSDTFAVLLYFVIAAVILIVGIIFRAGKSGATKA